MFKYFNNIFTEAKYMKKLVSLFIMILFLGTNAYAFEPQAKSIDIIVGYNAGGTNDKIARLLQNIFEKEKWKSSVIHKPGASQAIAANHVANESPKDGHTIFVSGIGLLDANLMFKEENPGIKYSRESFQSVIPLGTGTLVLTSSKDTKITTYEEFKNYVRANPTQFKIGFWNKHLGKTLIEWARLEKLPEPEIIYYEGSGAMIVDLLGGHIKFTLDSFTATNQHWKNDSLNILAVLDNKDGLKKIEKIKKNNKVISIPQVQPTFELYTYYGVYVSAGVDKETIQKIHKVINQGLQENNAKEFFQNIGVLDAGGDPKVLDQYSLDFVRLIQSSIKK